MGTVYSHGLGEAFVEAKTSGLEVNAHIAWDKLDDLIATLLCVRAVHAEDCSLSPDEYANLLKNYVNAER